jgi:hypothetical protein
MGLSEKQKLTEQAQQIVNDRGCLNVHCHKCGFYDICTGGAVDLARGFLMGISIEKGKA